MRQVSVQLKINTPTQPPPTLWQLRRDVLILQMLPSRERNLISNSTLEASEISHVKRRLETVMGENRQLRTRLTQVNCLLLN